MKSVLISIQPKWCELIASGKKTVEVRKTKPKIDTPFKVYIYQTKMQWMFNLLKKIGLSDLANKLLIGKGKVIGEFICDCITPLYNVCTDEWKYLHGALNEIEKELVKQSCLKESELIHYASGKRCYAWHISDLVIYDKPRELHHFFKPCGDCDKKGTRRCTEELTDCRAKVITRPPQSWCYVEGGAE